MNTDNSDMKIRSITGNFNEDLLEDVVATIRKMGPDESVALVKAGGSSIVIAKDKSKINLILVYIDFAECRYYVGV